MKKLITLFVLFLSMGLANAQESKNIDWLNNNVGDTERINEGYTCSPYFTSTGIYGLGDTGRAGFKWEDIDWICYTENDRIYIASNKYKGWYEYIEPKEGVEVSDVLYYIVEARSEFSGRTTYKNCGNYKLKDDDNE